MSLYWGYSKSPEARAAIVRERFAPRVRRFHSLRDVPVEQIIANVDRFFALHPNSRYELRRPIQVTAAGASGETSVRARVLADWGESCPDAWAREAWLCHRDQLLDVQLEADAEGRIIELVETPGPRQRYRVLADVKGYEEPHSGCDEVDGTPVVSLSRGQLVTALGPAISGSGCGPCESLRQFEQGGVIFWALTSSCETIHDPETGPHLGGTDYLEVVE
ncbi:MAG TPA: hypothetical protein VLC09_12690 [Polyangiaceae bacterium]|nr:hypothetical protein [Polyangiaceae bacterium]